MTKLWFKIFLLMIMTGASGCKDSARTEPEPLPAPSASPSPIPNPTPTQLGVMLVPDPETTTKAEAEMIKLAGAIMNRIVATPCFKKFISDRKLIQTNGLSPEQVAAHLQSLTGIVSVKMYYRCMVFGWRCLVPTQAVAYRQPPSTDVFLNQAYFYPDTKPENLFKWAGTLGHEVLGHSLGEYGHDFQSTANRILSVPYSINEAFDFCKDSK